jgi:hypothetical protein
MQLKVQWITKNQIAILKGQQVVAAPPVRYFKDRSYFLETQGNHKTKGVVGMINCVSNGCFRGVTGFEKCNEPCYNACYANDTFYARKHKWNGFDVTMNGVDNKYFLINLPAKPSYKLNTLKIWRIGSETSDMSLALAMDVVEPWVAANPDKFFTGISSDYFYVKADLLKKMANYDNFVVGHTISTWFGSDDLENRFTQIERFRDYGIPTMVWIVTKPEWTETKKGQLQEKKMVKRALSLVSKHQIIEVAYHHNQHHEPTTLNLNPAGVCCSTGTCKSCKLLCGVRWLLEARKNGRK